MDTSELVNNVLYRGLLSTFLYEVEEDGAVTSEDANTVSNVKVEGKNLYLGTRDVLARADWENEIVFHPISENVIRQESLIQRRVGLWINRILNFRLRQAMMMMLDFNSDTEMQKRMTGAQRKMLKEIAAAGKLSPTAIRNIKSVISKFQEKGDNRGIGIFVKRSNKDSKFRREAIVDIPMLDVKTVDKKNLVMGVSLTKNELSIYQAMAKYLLGENPDFSCGSMDTNAPYFCSLVGAYVKVSEKLNEFFALFGELVPEFIDLLKVDLSWWELVTPDNIKKFRTIIPVTPGNDGEYVKKVEEGAKAVMERPSVSNDNVAPVTTSSTPAPSVTTETVAPASAEPAPIPGAPKRKSVGWADYKTEQAQAQSANFTQGAQVAPAVPQPYTHGASYATPAPRYQQPVAHTPQPAQPQMKFVRTDMSGLNVYTDGQMEYAFDQGQYLPIVNGKIVGYAPAAPAAPVYNQGGSQLPPGVSFGGHDNYGQPIYIDQYGNRVNISPAPQPAPVQHHYQQRQDQYGNVFYVDQYGNPVNVNQPAPAQYQNYNQNYSYANQAPIAGDGYDSPGRRRVEQQRQARAAAQYAQPRQGTMYQQHPGALTRY